MIWLLAQSGGNNPSPWSNPNTIKFAIWAIVIVFSVIGGIVKFIAQKREEARIRAAKRRREEDLLRTGRTEGGMPVSAPSASVAAAGPTSHEEARRRLQEIAQRRRTELQQMAQRGGDASAPPIASGPMPVARPTPPSSAPAPHTSRPFQPRPMTPTGPAFPSARPHAEPARPKSGQRQDQRKKQKTQQQRPPQHAPKQPTLADKLMQPVQAATGAYAVAQQTHTSTAPATPSTTAARRGTHVTLDRATTPAGIESLRKALVLAEVLAPSISMRPDSDGTTGGPLMQRAG